MRLLVISDSHGKSGVIDRILLSQPKALNVFFLGDKVEDIEDMIYLYPERNFYIVSGNCDFFSSYKSFDFVKLGKHKILFTHGHTFGVKYGSVSALKKAASQNGCDIVLYGHTHIANTEYENGLYIVNPGSCSCSREGSNSYAVIDLLDNGILPQIIEI